MTSASVGWITAAVFTTRLICLWLTLLLLLSKATLWSANTITFAAHCWERRTTWYFSIYNCESDEVQIYRLKTLPFGATHSVYNFLRLAPMLYYHGAWIVFDGNKFLWWFYLGITSAVARICGSRNGVSFSAHGVVLCQGGQEGNSVRFDLQALGVQFNFHRPKDFLMHVENTEARKKEICGVVGAALEIGRLGKAESLILRGKVGFADSFIHGRLGALTLKKLSEHAYGRTSKLSPDVTTALQAMSLRLKVAGPRMVTSSPVVVAGISSRTQPTNKVLRLVGLGVCCLTTGAVLAVGSVLKWPSLSLASRDQVSNSLWSMSLRWRLQIVAMQLWGRDSTSNLHVCYGDNDSARFSLIRASGSGEVACFMLGKYLNSEAENNARTWLARVPTEANIADFPSRFKKGWDCMTISLAMAVQQMFSNLWLMALMWECHIVKRGVSRWHPPFEKKGAITLCCALNCNWRWSSPVIKLSLEVDSCGDGRSQLYVWSMISQGVGGWARIWLLCWKAPTLKPPCFSDDKAFLSNVVWAFASLSSWLLQLARSCRRFTSNTTWFFTSLTVGVQRPNPTVRIEVASPIWEKRSDHFVLWPQLQLTQSC